MKLLLGEGDTKRINILVTDEKSQDLESWEFHKQVHTKHYNY